MRRTEGELKKEKINKLKETIIAGCEDGLRMMEQHGKGRGVIATKNFCHGDFVLEYRGELIQKETADKREKEYANRLESECYMYYFKFKNSSYCVDATAESEFLGRLVNHSIKKPNLVTKIIEVNGIPHLIFFASRNISSGDEILYDYGERNVNIVDSYPWLLNS